MNSLPVAWIDTLRLSRQPQVSAENVFVTLEEVQTLISVPVPENNLVLLRDQAAAAMLFLSGMRASAFTTLPISGMIWKTSLYASGQNWVSILKTAKRQPRFF